MRPWYIILLAAVAVAVITIGITELGTPTSSARTSKETVTAANGVVQTTVSGSGNVEPGVDQAVNFGTGGTLQSVNVTVGQHVKKGQLIASLDPSTAELTLEEAQTSLTAAEDQLTADEDGDSSSSSSSDGSSSGDASGDASAASASASAASATTASVASVRRPNDGTTDTSTTTTPTTSTTTTATTPTTTTPTTTRTTPQLTTTTPKRTATTPKRTATTPKRTATTPKRTATTPKRTTTNTTTTAGQTKTTSAVQIAQGTEQVEAAEETVKSDQTALDNTKLYAPVSGTIASLSSDTIGQTVSSGGSSSSGSSSSGSSSAAASAASSSDSGSSGSSNSGSGFAEIIDSNTMTMTVSLSESDISSVKVGQVATVSITALSGVELGGHVTAISPLGSDSSGVVTYDATLTIDQTNSKVLPGMSATATIVTQQAQGVTVPNQAITGTGTNGTVELIKDGKATPQTVVVGLRGSSRSVILSGLKAGQQVQITITLPALGTSSSSSSSSSSTLGGTTGFGGGGFAGRGALRAFFGGGGGGTP